MYSVAVTDLQTGETIGVNEDRMQLAGCVINLPVLMQSTLDMQAGRVAIDQADPLIAETIHHSNPVTASDLSGLSGQARTNAGKGKSGDIRLELGGCRHHK